MNKVNSSLLNRLSCSESESDVVISRQISFWSCGNRILLLGSPGSWAKLPRSTHGKFEMKNLYYDECWARNWCPWQNRKAGNCASETHGIYNCEAASGNFGRATYQSQKPWETKHTEKRDKEVLTHVSLALMLWLMFLIRKAAYPKAKQVASTMALNFPLDGTCFFVHYPSSRVRKR